MRAADTNVLVRLIVRDDDNQLASASAFVSNGIWISHLVLAETIWALDSIYGLSHSNLVEALEMLLSQEYVVLEAGDVVSAALEKFRKSPRPGFSDCLILEIARKAGHLPLGTFDRNLAKLDDTHKL